jgi:hypothetical protein
MADMAAGFPSPNWVILGVTVEDGVMVVASTTLTEAVLRYQVTELEAVQEFMSIRAPMSRHMRIETGMHNMVMIRERTYGRALRRLWELWDPDADGTELTAGDLPIALERPG